MPLTNLLRTPLFAWRDVGVCVTQQYMHGLGLEQLLFFTRWTEEILLRLIGMDPPERQDLQYVHQGGLTNEHVKK